MAGRDGDKLTDLQRRFAEEYLVDLNATEAAKRAGYSADTAGQIGHQVRHEPKVAALISQLQAERSARTKISQDRVLTEIGRIAFVDPRKIFSWGPSGVELRPSDELDPDDAAVVTEASRTTTETGSTVKIKLADKVAALTLAGKHLGMFTDKFEHVVSDTKAFELAGRALAAAGFTEEQAAAVLAEMRKDLEESAHPR